MAVASSGSVTDPAGTITGAEFHSATMGEDISYNVYLPAGYSSTATRYPVIYLLHGRGDSKSAWTQVIDHVDTTYRTIASRDGRVIGGYSMGGYGAMRYSIAHPDLFAASIVLSPAVYNPVPAQDSSARTFGAFGQGGALFVDAIYRRLDYPAELPRFSAKNLPSHMFIAVGDDEYQNPSFADYIHDLDFESHVLYKWAEHTPNLSSELRVLNGGHSWDVWSPAFEEGAKYAFQFVARPQVSVMKATLTGTAGEDREGGVATDASGTVNDARATEGSVDRQSSAGAKVFVLSKCGPTGA